MEQGSTNELLGIIDRTWLLLQREQTYLRTYWNELRSSFRKSAETRRSEVSVTSTSFCVFALLQHPQAASEFFPDPSPGGPCVIGRVADALVDAEWKSEDLEQYNVYTAPIVLCALYEMEKSGHSGDRVASRLNKDDAKEKIKVAVDAILGNRSSEGGARFRAYAPGAYLSYWAWRALRHAAADARVGTKRRQRCCTGVEELALWAEAEVNRQLALESAGDSALFDATQLAYATVIYAQGRPRIKPNQRLITRAVDRVFSCQLEGGLWAKSYPIFHYGSRGSAYAFTHEMLDVMLSAPDAIAPSVFRAHASRLSRALSWAEENCADEGTIKGWRSDTLAEPDGPEAWSTAAVFLAASRMSALAKRLVNDDVLDEFAALRFSQPDGAGLSRSRFYDSKLPVPGGNSLRKVLKKHFVDAHMPDGNAGDKRYSAVLYGPPGTAKTSLARAVAQALGWPLVCLQSSDFLEEGFDRITGSARRIFRELGRLDKTVVLFDEVEEFVRNRDDDGTDAKSRLITTAMLTLIQELRAQKSVILMVATNHLDKFDPAIMRAGGRFDLILLVGPPSKAEKIRMFRDGLSERPELEPHADELQDAFEAFVDDHYDETICFFSYPEWKPFIDRVIDGLGDRPSIDAGALERELKSRARGIALRGEVRESYLRSRKSVRLR